jgi:hypothetical protein
VGQRRPGLGVLVEEADRAEVIGPLYNGVRILAPSG